MIKCPVCGKPAVEWASQYRLYVCTGCLNHFCREEQDEIIQKEKTEFIKWIERDGFIKVKK